MAYGYVIRIRLKKLVIFPSDTPENHYRRHLPPYLTETLNISLITAHSITKGAHVRVGGFRGGRCPVGGECPRFLLTGVAAESAWIGAINSVSVAAVRSVKGPLIPCRSRPAPPHGPRQSARRRPPAASAPPPPPPPLS